MNDLQSRIDPEFTALPLRELADAALAQAKSLGAQHADFRAERIRGQQIGLSDGNLQTLFDADDTGLAVRVIMDGTWGFASAVDLTADAAAQAARQAVEVAQVAAAMNTEPIELAPEPAYGEVTWVSAYDVDPFTVSVADKVVVPPNVPVAAAGVSVVATAFGTSWKHVDTDESAGVCVESVVDSKAS